VMCLRTARRAGRALLCLQSEQPLSSCECECPGLPVMGKGGESEWPGGRDVEGWRTRILPHLCPRRLSGSCIVESCSSSTLETRSCASLLLHFRRFGRRTAPCGAALLRLVTVCVYIRAVCSLSKSRGNVDCWSMNCTAASSHCASRCAESTLWEKSCALVATINA
jgi:hypothetical protein